MPKQHSRNRNQSRRRPARTDLGRSWQQLRPGYEVLEDRTLLTFALADVIQAYNNGVAAVGTASNVTALVDQVLGTNALPVANQTLDQALSLVQDFAKPFQTALNANAPDWPTVAAQLQAAGFSIPVAFTGTPDCNSNLVEVTWSPQTLTPKEPIQILGQTGLSYLDGAGGGLFGGITATGSVNVALTYGVDVDPTTMLPSFFVAPAANVVQATLSGSTAGNGLSGSLAIGDLANVSAAAGAGVSFTGSLGLQATAADKDGKLRMAELTGN